MSWIKRGLLRGVTFSFIIWVFFGFINFRRVFTGIFLATYLFFVCCRSIIELFIILFFIRADGRVDLTSFFITFCVCFSLLFAFHAFSFHIGFFFSTIIFFIFSVCHRILVVHLANFYINFIIKLKHFFFFFFIRFAYQVSVSFFF